MMNVQSYTAPDGSRLGFLWLLCAAFVAAGAVTGAVVFSRTFSAQDVQACIDAQRALPREFAQAFMRYAVRELIVLAAVVLLGCFAFGWLLVPGVLFCSGLGTGIKVCCICASLGWFGAIYALLVIALPSAVAAVSVTLCAREATSISFDMLGFMLGRRERERNRRRLLIRLPLCAGGTVCAAAFGAIMRNLLYTFIL